MTGIKLGATCRSLGAVLLVVACAVPSLAAGCGGASDDKTTESTGGKAGSGGTGSAGAGSTSGSGGTAGPGGTGGTGATGGSGGAGGTGATGGSGGTGGTGGTGGAGGTGDGCTPLRVDWVNCNLETGVFYTQAKSYSQETSPNVIFQCDPGVILVLEGGAIDAVAYTEKSMTISTVDCVPAGGSILSFPQSTCPPPPMCP